MMESLKLFLQDKDGRLKDQWQASIKNLVSRMGEFRPDSRVFEEIKNILMNLVTLVAKKGSAEQAVDSILKPIVSNLKTLQTENNLSPTEMVLFLFLMRDIVREILKEKIGEAQRQDNQGGVLSFNDALDQVSMLLNRLGLVFFESSMRLKEEDGFNQDVMAIEYALLYERTRQIAITDRLTGLYNFGYFLERLKEERVRAERYHRLLSLILFDIDHFKRYNDTNGHPAGNEVLKKIAEILRNEAREVDIVARYGGEEMVLILPETSRKRAFEMAERIREKIASTPFEHSGQSLAGKLTISAGVATFPVDAASEEELIQKADSSLYQAKSEGRDKVVAFDPPIKVTLNYRPTRELSKVSLVGNFNNWDKDVDAMIRQPDGTFQFIIALIPGVYHYKFVLNDVEWIPDPACPERVHDTLGGDNSVLRVQG
jgi:diguanylate cyclase (GGDEF)-like protein